MVKSARGAAPLLRGAGPVVVRPSSISDLLIENGVSDAAIAARADPGHGVVASPSPSGRCIMTQSTQRPRLKPIEVSSAAR